MPFGSYFLKLDTKKLDRACESERLEIPPFGRERRLLQVLKVLKSSIH